jgi:hypothetical protein
MASLDEFLKQNPDLYQDDALLEADSSQLRLDVVLLGVSSRFVKFNHMGTDYVVDRDHVVGIEEREDRSVAGKAVTLTVTRDAALLASYSVSATDVASALPFSLFRAPAAPLRRGPSAREIAWRRSARYEYSSEYPSLEIYLTPCGTETASESYSNGRPVDTIGDDEKTDFC